MSRKVPPPTARFLVESLRTLTRVLPAPLRRHLDDRVFYAVHQLTRVTNDHYPGANPSTPPKGDSPPDNEQKVDSEDLSPPSESG